MDTKKTVPEILEEAAQTYRQRHLMYGDNYKDFGGVMQHLFPTGIDLDVCLAEDLVRLGLIVNIVTKLGRYCANFATGGHQDSVHDLMVYAAMLEEMTNVQCQVDGERQLSGIDEESTLP